MENLRKHFEMQGISSKVANLMFQSRKFVCWCSQEQINPFCGTIENPSYIFAWDVKDVSDFIRSNWRRNKDSSTTKLTLNLTMLLKLTAATRVSSIQHFNIKYMAMTKDQYIFVFINCKKLKQKGKSLTLITFHAYSHDKQLCAVDALKEYILITSDF